MPYYNFKYVALDSPLLSRLHKGLMAAIVVYVLVVLVGVNKGYLSFDPVVGTTRVRLVKMHAKPETAFPYCVPAPAGTAPSTVHCVVWDEADVRYPAEGHGAPNAVFLTTAVELSHQWRERDGRPFITQNQTFWRVAGVEEYWLLATHNVQAPRHFEESGGDAQFAHSEKSMKGVLLGADGRTVVAEFTHPKEDVLKLTDLLAAARPGGLDLDAASDRVVRGRLNTPFNAFRDRGLSLVVTVTYDNTKGSWFGTTDVRYEYRVRHIHESEYAVTEPDYTVLPHAGARTLPPVRDDPVVAPGTELPPLAKDEPLRPHPAVQPLPAHLKLTTASTARAERMLRERRGVHITFVQTGQLARFSVHTLVLQVVSGMGLLAAAATIVESLLFYALPNRQKYIDAVIEEATLPADATATPAAPTGTAVPAKAVVAGGSAKPRAATKKAE